VSTNQENYEFHELMKQNKKAEKQAKRAYNEQQHNIATADLTFQGWPKIARLNRDIVITEKIDGTNAAIGIGPPAGTMRVIDDDLLQAFYPAMGAGKVWAQSRTRLLSPYDDNMGFAAWVEKHRELLITTLGPGLHFGEWYGQGIQRGYGLTENRFALFNTERWSEGEGALALANARLNECAIYCVPVLSAGSGWVVGDMFYPDSVLANLGYHGSSAVPGFMKPEGIVVWHKASGTLFKATLENDEKPKNSREVS
jgi:hypothetical protein